MSVAVPVSVPPALTAAVESCSGPGRLRTPPALNAVALAIDHARHGALSWEGSVTTYTLEVPVTAIPRTRVEPTSPPSSWLPASNARAVLLPFLVSRVLFGALTLSASRLWTLLPLQGLVSRYGGGPHAYWYRWDAEWYVRIALDGYHQVQYPYSQSVVFFPLYPGLLHLVLLLWPLPPIIAAVLIANLCCLGAFFLLYRVVALDYGHGRAARAVWLFALFPTGLYLFAGYSESLFLLLFLLCCYLLRLHRWWWAGMAGGLAAATRSVGIIALLPFAVAWCQTYGAAFRATTLGSGSVATRPSRAAAVRALAAGALIPAGIVGYAVYLWLRFGNPWLFSSSEHAWGRVPTLPWRTLSLAATAQLAHLPAPTLAGLVASQDTLFALLFLALSVPAVFLLTRAHALLLWGVWAVALSTPVTVNHYPDPLISLPRYLLAAFPLLIVLAATPRRAMLGAVCFATLLILNTVVFLNGGWVA